MFQIVNNWVSMEVYERGTTRGREFEKRNRKRKRERKYKFLSPHRRLPPPKMSLLTQVKQMLFLTKLKPLESSAFNTINAAFTSKPNGVWAYSIQFLKKSRKPVNWSIPENNISVLTNAGENDCSCEYILRTKAFNTVNPCCINHYEMSYFMFCSERAFFLNSWWYWFIFSISNNPRWNVLKSKAHFFFKKRHAVTIKF